MEVWEPVGPSSAPDGPFFFGPDRRGRGWSSPNRQWLTKKGPERVLGVVVAALGSGRAGHSGGGQSQSEPNKNSETEPLVFGRSAISWYTEQLALWTWTWDDLVAFHGCVCQALPSGFGTWVQLRLAPKG